jgi:hypothetical protein
MKATRIVTRLSEDRHDVSSAVPTGKKVRILETKAVAVETKDYGFWETFGAKIIQ